MGSFADPAAPLSAPLDLYLHGYVSSRLMRLPGATTTTTSTTGEQEQRQQDEDQQQESGLPLCIAATHLDGLILALTPTHHSLNYRSAILHGHAHRVTSAAEKTYATRLLTENTIPGRWAATRVPPSPAEMHSTAVLRVVVADASAKVRCGGPGEDRADERDAALRARVWTGVVPAWTAYGAPVPAGGNRVGEVPAHVVGLVEGRNREGERAAREAAGGLE
ncbi:hypothetical protein MMC26_000256 [Xylographa opegraphella]|nr:hypothetical protein [Xylographa opegraphella]